MTKLTNLDKINELIKRGALFVVNHSAGKDSQAMHAELVKIVPAAQLLVVHADLGRIEWSGNIDHIKATIGDLPFIIAKPYNKAGEFKELLDVVKSRGKWPDSARRWCTSDFKRGPLEREIKRYIKAEGLSGLVVNCMGLRADESAARAKKVPFAYSERNSKAGREWYDWLPIFRFSSEDVFEVIRQAGQEPHWAYGAGMSRLSCSFCIFANQSDLQTAARLRPELYAEYVELEREIDHTFSMSRRPLEEVTGLKVADVTSAGHPRLRVVAE
jgi:3'-phosphoadenosine 5'-phosphosulfate sulfotransferase (PAPS reductase)/FAD synthetase